jgi:hypothetical protein
MIRKILTLALGSIVILSSQNARGQQKTDTVIVSLGRTSKVIFTMEDRSDLEILKHYNFQDLFQDILKQIEQSNSDTVPVVVSEKEPVTEQEDSTQNESPKNETREDENWGDNRGDRDDGDDEVDNDDDDDEDWERKIRHRRGRIGRTSQSFNFDLGTNNYLSDGKFPDENNALHAVRPWGSWYLAASSIQRTRVSGTLFLEWGLGLNWYNFKFQNDDVMMRKDDDGLYFETDLRDVNHRKSKLTATYINASFIPVLDFGGHGIKPRMWDGNGSSFRIGIGPYIGYRISSRSKLVYKDDGDLEKEKDRNSFYLNNFRYGARLQLGFHGTDLFFNYDLNELFVEGKGPKLNAFSFGVIF